jgi:hypothetical protein
MKLTLHRLLTAIVFIAIFTMAVRVPADSDTWWHLQSGRWIVENQAIPRTDPFSHTRFGETWVDHGWLAQIILYLVFDAGSYAGLALLVASLVTAAFSLIWLQVQDANRWLRAFVLIIAATTSGVIWAARPQMFSFVMTAAASYLLFRFKRGDQRAIWWMPVLILVWVNTHGGFAVGFILMFAYLFGELGNQILRNDGMAWREMGRLALVMGICLLVIPLNPNGVQMWAYPFRTVGIGVLQDFIQEWRTPDFHQLHLHPFIWMLLAALTSLGLSGRRADFTDLTLTALFTYMSLLAGRNVALFALVAAPLIIRHADSALDGWSERMGWKERLTVRVRPQGRLFTVLNWVLLGLLCLAALVKISQPINSSVNEEAQAESLPVEAVSFLERERPRGPIFNSYNWGGYLIWRLPDYPVFVDGRTDLYDDAFLREYLSIIHARGEWEAALDSYGINLVLIETESMVGRLLVERPGWDRVYHDEMATVFVRK